MSVDRDGLVLIAEKCVDLVHQQFGLTLDWTIDSLVALDGVCERLHADGDLTGERFDLWWRVVGAYVGEVTVRLYDGTWIEHEQAVGAYAVSVLGLIGFPFATTARVLEGEYGKSLASSTRALPAIADRSKAKTSRPASTATRRWWPWPRTRR